MPDPTISLRFWPYWTLFILLVLTGNVVAGVRCEGKRCREQQLDARSRYNRFFDSLGNKDTVRNTLSRFRRHFNRKRAAPRHSTSNLRAPVRYNAYVNAPQVPAPRVSIYTPTSQHQQIAKLNLYKIKMHHARLRQAQLNKILQMKQLSNKKPWWGTWSSWSACGRTCGSGVQFQERHCLRTRSQVYIVNGGICNGPTKRYRICNSNNCPAHTPSFRKLQCSQHAAEQIRGEYYSWKPYGHPVDEVVSNQPCQLVCVSNVDEIQINTVAMDGTECRMGWNMGRCVEGNCRLIGCDGQIDSTKLRNKCGKCDGSGTSCEVHNEIFSKMLPSKGEYEVAQIPRDAYDILVIERRKTSANIVVKDVQQETLFNGGGFSVSGEGAEGWPSNVMIAGTEFRYRKPILQSSLTGFEYLLGAGPIKEPILIYLRAIKPGYGHLHYEYKVPTPEYFANTTKVSETHDVEATSTTQTSDTQATTSFPVIEVPTTSITQLPTTSQATTTTTTTTTFRNTIRPPASSTKKTLERFTQPKIKIPVRISEKPKIILLPELTDKNEPNDNQIPISHYEFMEEETEPNTDEQEEDFLFLRQIDVIERKPGMTDEEHNSNGSVQIPTDEVITDFIKPPLRFLQKEPDDVFVQLDNLNETKQIARVYTVQRHLPTDNETYNGTNTDLRNRTKNNNETDDYDVAGGEDDIPADGGEDYVIAPGVDIPIPVRYGTGISGRYSKFRYFEWITTGFAPCSSTCTSGLQDSYAVCKRKSDKLQVDDSYCNPTTRPEPVRRACLNKKCEPRWVTTKWSECSMSCGKGVQMRTVRCWQMIGPGFDSTLYKESCKHIGQEEPEDTRPCQVLEQCGPLWETSDWSDCPAPCGKIGVKWRTVRCSAGRDQLCASRPRPYTEEECRGPPCVLRWAASRWSPCSGECGGRTTRRVFCVDRMGNQRPEDQCDPSSKPTTSHPCGDVNCRPQWISQDWEECSLKCGNGTRTREVMCAGIVNGQVLKYGDDSRCSSTPKPRESEACHLRDCDPVWFTTPWSKCSVTCGSGKLVRKVKCYLGSVPAEGCDPDQKPPETESCDLAPCPQMKSEQCKDKTTVNCALVLRVRLCSHWYYSKACCESCQSRNTSRRSS